MVRMYVFLICILSYAYSQKIPELDDGKPVDFTFDQLFGGQKEYKYKIPADFNSTDTDLSITLTTFQDWSDPDLYVSMGRHAIKDDTDYESVAWGMGSVIIPSYELQPGTVYFILVSCYTYCSYTINASLSQEIDLKDGIPQTAYLEADQEKLYNFQTGPEQNDKLTFTVIPSNGAVELNVVAYDEAETPNPDNSEPINDLIGGGKTCTITSPKKNMFYMAGVIAMTTSRYTITASTSSQAVQLQASVPVHGEVEQDTWQMYKIFVGNNTENVNVQLTPYSGSADMYISAEQPPTLKEYDFSITHFKNETISITREEREELGHVTGDYYIGIFGAEHATFALFAQMNTTSAIPLIPGVFQNGRVYEDRMQYYYLDLPIDRDIDFNITIDLSRSSGSPDLYVKLCTTTIFDDLWRFDAEDIADPELFTTVMYKQSNHADVGMKLIHKYYQCDEGRPCSYVIGVYGASPEVSIYSLIGTWSQQTALALRKGQPVNDQVEANLYKYFMYTVNNATTSQLDIKLSPITGDSDLFVSRSDRRPGIFNYEKFSKESSAILDKVTYKLGTDGDNLLGTYHISVYGVTQSQFSIVATESNPGQNNTVTLLPGKAQRDTLTPGDDTEYLIYRFRLHYTEENKQPFSIHLTPILGTFTLYVTNSPKNLQNDIDMFYYDWCDCKNDTKNPTNRDRTVSVAIDDPFYLPDATYLVLVMADSFAENQTATYSITFQTGGDGVSNLQEGIPFNDEVQAGEYKYYVFPIHYNHEDVTISVTAFTGDPDMYISAEKRSPTKDDNDYASSNYGSEVFTLIWEDKLKEECPDLPEEYTFGDETHCNLYIGVFGFEPSSYSIKVVARKDLPSQLTLGDPSYGEMERTEYLYYYLMTSNENNIDVVLQPLSGDCDLFVNVLDYAKVSDAVEDWNRPNQDTMPDYKSQNAVISEEVNIPHDDLSNLCPSGNCIILMGVLCFEGPCQFQLNSSQDSAFTLIEGVPHQAYVGPGQYSHYRYYNDLERTNLLITITALDDGDPDLFVRKGREKTATIIDYMWSSQTWGGEHMLITKEDDYFKPANSTMIGQYSISVLGYIESSYIITVSSKEELMTRLIPGAPTNAVTGDDNIRYFYYHNIREDNVIFTITPRSCKTILTVNTQNVNSETLFGRLPTEYSYQWSSIQETDQHQIVIERNSTNYCTNCNYVLGVFTTDAECSYRIIGSNDIHFTFLANGVPFRACAIQTGMEYFKTEVTKEGKFDISLSVYSGTAELYVSQDPQISEEVFTWSSSTSSTTEHISIENASGIYYIGVKVFKNSEYSITAHQSNSYVELVSGWPQEYAISHDPEDALFFKYEVNTDEDEKVECHVTSLSPGFAPIVYVVKRSQRGFTTNKPSKRIHTAVYELHEAYDEVTMMLDGGTGQYEFGVYGGGDGNLDLIGRFQISCSTIDSYTVVWEGETEYGNIEKLNYHKRYELYLNETRSIEVDLTPWAGRADLTISTNATQHVPVKYTASHSDGATRAILHNAQGKYYFTVKSILLSPLINSTSYEISAHIIDEEGPEQKYIIPGNEGFIQYSQIGKSILLDWEAPTFEDGDPVGESISYMILVSNSDGSEHMMVTSCAIKTLLSEGLAYLEGEPVQVPSGQVMLKESEDKYIINVLAVIDREGKFDKRVAYRPIEVRYRQGHSVARYNAYWPIVIGIVTFCLAVTLLLTMILYWKYKKSERKLDYELSDVRNVAGVSSSIGGLMSDYAAPQRSGAYGQLSTNYQDHQENGNQADKNIF